MSGDIIQRLNYFICRVLCFYCKKEMEIIANQWTKLHSQTISLHHLHEANWAEKQLREWLIFLTCQNDNWNSNVLHRKDCQDQKNVHSWLENIRLIDEIFTCITTTIWMILRVRTEWWICFGECIASTSSRHQPLPTKLKSCKTCLQTVVLLGNPLINNKSLY